MCLILMAKLKWKPQATGNANRMGCLPRIAAWMELNWFKEEVMYGAGGRTGKVATHISCGSDKYFPNSRS